MLTTNVTRSAEFSGDKLIRPVGSIYDWAADNLHGLMIGAIVAAAIVAVMLLMRAFGRRLLAKHPDCNTWSGIIGSVLAKTTVLFMVAAAIDIVVSYAPIPPKLDRLAGIIFTVAAAIQGAIWVRELILGAVRSRVDETGEGALGNAMAIIRVLVSVAVFAIAALVILDNLGVNVTTLVAGLGIGGIAIGLAAQGIFADLFAALAILFDKPFRRGDTINYGGKVDAGGTTGTVERIGLKTTRIRSRTGELIVMNNTKLLEQELTNVDEAKVYRIWLPFGVIYQTPPEQLEAMADLMQEVLQPMKGIRFVRCAINGFGPSSIDFQLVYDDRGKSFDERAKNRSDICIGIMRAFAAHKIDFAYPTQTTFTAAPDGTMIMPYAAVQPVQAVEKALRPKAAKTSKA